jgi:CubicO group peptidase (beta-lactamase class C family)
MTTADAVACGLPLNEETPQSQSLGMISRIIISLALLSIASAAAATELYFPEDTWETVKPGKVGWREDQLESAVDFAMSRNSSGVVVLYRGRILAERYQELPKKSLRYRGMLHGRDSAGRVIEDVASVQKSVVSFLVGVARERKLIAIDDPVHQYLGVGWSKAKPQQEAVITVRHLLTMTSGLNDKLEFAAPAGTKWKYNTSAYARCLNVIAAASGKSSNELTSEWLTTPAGMQDSRWVERSRNSGVLAARHGFATTARDLARFGLLILAEGRWSDEILLHDKKYLAASLAPSQKLNPSYGYLWWLNGQASTVRAGRAVSGPLLKTAPTDLRAALGALGRKCYIVPSLDLVVTRLGDSPEALRLPKFDEEFWKLLMAAAPK